MAIFSLKNWILKVSEWINNRESWISNRESYINTTTEETDTYVSEYVAVFPDLADSNQGTSSDPSAVAKYNNSFKTIDTLLEENKTAQVSLRATKAADGRSGAILSSYRKVNDTDIWNNLNLYIANDGTKSVGFSEPSIWRRDLNYLPTGSCYITSTNTNPGTDLGYGTWSLIDKRFAPASGNTNSEASDTTKAVVFNTTNTQSGSYIWKKTDHEIWIRLNFQNKVAFNDNAQDICTINGSKIGITQALWTTYPFAHSDGLNAGIMCSLSWSGTTGTLTKQDVTSSAGTRSTETGVNCYCELRLEFTNAQMNDSMCNQFIWQRTA